MIRSLFIIIVSLILTTPSVFAADGVVNVVNNATVPGITSPAKTKPVQQSEKPQITGTGAEVKTETPKKQEAITKQQSTRFYTHKELLGKLVRGLIVAAIGIVVVFILAFTAKKLSTKSNKAVLNSEAEKTTQFSEPENLSQAVSAFVRHRLK